MVILYHVKNFLSRVSDKYFLIDFKLKPPYLPNVKDVQIELNENNLFDNMIQEDKTILTRKEGDDIPPDYNRKWADEF
jgi:hypothetical protein